MFNKKIISLVYCKKSQSVALWALLWLANFSLLVPSYNGHLLFFWKNNFLRFQVNEKCNSWDLHLKGSSPSLLQREYDRGVLWALRLYTTQQYITWHYITWLTNLSFIISFLTMEYWIQTLQYFLGARGLLHSTLSREYTDYLSRRIMR